MIIHFHPSQPPEPYAELLIELLLQADAAAEHAAANHCGKGDAVLCGSQPIAGYPQTKPTN